MNTTRKKIMFFLFRYAEDQLCAGGSGFRLTLQQQELTGSSCKKNVFSILN